MKFSNRDFWLNMCFIVFIFASCAKDGAENGGSETTMFDAVKNGKEAHLWLYVPKENSDLQCWYYAITPAAKGNLAATDVQVSALNVFAQSKSLSGGKAQHIKDIYKEVSFRVLSKDGNIRSKNKGIMVLWGDMLTQLEESKAYGNLDCASKKGNIAFLGSASRGAESLQMKCRVEPLNSLYESQNEVTRSPIVQTDSDWNRLDALKFAISDAKTTAQKCPSVNDIATSFRK